ncbi:MULTISPECIES: hypothetical protein [unclassified Haloferax]|jgi:hypothetical protein|uniref:hypothetical protein n=1 Tax=unclassified Haloferax TaxID=2625095 RepID=UPI0028763390|nr:MULTISPECIES: hypothetical protein [unclassified Haloferax]MDS0243179.1 hypothetical protein [Haloferax sp. S2CR25]MDS0446300.1 hypothetical protein [Haloferax sp. S2CR25-2]
MAIACHNSDSETPVGDIREALADIFENHNDRSNKSEFACVEFCIDEREKGSPRYRYLDGSHYLRKLTSSQQDILKQEFVENGDLAVLSEGSSFLTLTQPDSTETGDVETAEEILEEFYNVSLEEVELIEEVVDAKTRLALNVA